MRSAGDSASPPVAGGPIVHVITGLETGGTELMLARLLRSSGRADQLVVSLGGRGPVGAQIEDAGFPVVPLRLRTASGLCTGLPRLVRLIRRSGAPIVQGWLAQGSLVATAAHRLAGGNRVLLWNIRRSLTGVGLEKPAARAIIRLNARLSRRPDFILYNSEAGARQHEAIGYLVDKRRIIPNGFDLDRNSPDPARRQEMRQHLGVEPDEVLIGLIGRFHPHKNHRGFLQAASMILAEEPRARFLCAGSGATLDNREFAALVTDPQVRQHGLFLGVRDDVPDLTRALDIACNVSIGEGFSNAIGEAMATGVPCVATDVGDSRAIIADTGLISAAHSPESIAAALLTIVRGGSEARQELGQAARRRMEACFSIEFMVRRYEDTYEESVAKSLRKHDA